MPLREYKCECGARFERLMWHSEGCEEMPCSCGKMAVKIVSSPKLLPGKVNPSDMNGHREMVEAGMLDD